MATFNGDDDDNILTGLLENDSLFGFDGNDTLYGGEGDDTLNGGTGNDFLQGDAGADAYAFSIGDGLDVINNYDTDSSVDVVMFNGFASTGITAAYQLFNTTDLVLQYAGGQLTLIGYFNNDTNYRIDQFQFTDVIWDITHIAQRHNGTSFSETLYAFDDMANTLNGLEGNDTLNGGNNADTLNGGAGIDSLYGNIGDDVLTGGTGNDFLQGDAGVDAYAFSSGDGLDVINNYDIDSSVDVVTFNGFASTGVTAVFQQFATTDLVLQYAGGQLTLIGYFNNDANYRVDQFQFTNVTWGITHIAQRHNGTSNSETLYAFDAMANTLNGLEGDDTLNGGNNADTLSGGAGNDNLYGNIGNDVLTGGTGNDYMQGNDGADTYWFSKGDGLDVINNYDTDSSVDIARFTDLASTEVTAVFEQFGTDDLVLQYAGGQLTVGGYFSGDANYRINQFRFTDANWNQASIAQRHNGTSFSETLYAYDGMANTINGLDGDDGLVGGNNADTLNGGAGNDNLYGNIGNDVLTGGTGNDFLQGDANVDTYWFSKGDGLDEIWNYDTDNSVDNVKFTDLASTEVLAVFEQFNTDNLVLQYAGGQLTVDGYFSGDANYRVNQFQFTDSNWSLGSIAQRHNGTSYSETLYAFDGMANTINGLAGKDILVGGTGADKLNGGSGYDSLYGGNSADTLTGGAGNDYLQGDSGADTYIFSKTDGKDEIGNYDTDSSVDIVKFTDLASIGITAALRSPVDANHLLIQYGGSNSLTVDYYFSGDVNYRVDQFQFTGGITVVNFVVGTTGIDILSGSTGNDVLSGLAGADKLTGKSGSDLYFIDDVGDVVVEGAGVVGDVDTVKSSVSHTLANNVENLMLTGAAINGTGNTQGNQLTGNGGNNILDGGAGADTLKGGVGADTFVLGTVTGGADAVGDFVSGTDHLQLGDGALALNIGNGDHIINNGIKTTTGAFSNAAELVIISSAIAGPIDNASAAAIIGSATGAYGLGDTRLFTVSNGTDSALYLFESAGADALVNAAELTLVGTLQGTAQTALADYAFA